MIADAIVVGTGAGGGPAAAILAEAGLRVVVLEAGPRLGAGDFTGDEAEMTARLWKFGMAGNALAVYAGACVGGSTVVNDALCFRTPPEILAHWRDDHGLRGLTDEAWAPLVTQAWEDVHAVPTDRAHQSRNAEVLAVGAARLGWAAGPTPRSVRDCANLGLCNFGCPSNAKQSTLLAYVPRAERAGARILPDTRVERIRIANGKVAGVTATSTGGATVTIDAPLVCVAAGVLETPALLQRSGARAGDGVAFHTSVHVTARCREAIHGYYGPTMGYAVTEFSDVDGHRGPGFMIENTSVMPIATATALPGFGAVHAERMAQLSRLARALVVNHDRTRGRVAADGTVTADLVPDDVERLRRGIRETARAFLAAGVEEVWLPVGGFAPIRAERDLAALDGARLAADAFSLVYAVHLFGGAAMGTVCDEDGSVRGVRGLYVCDAASLPSNTGVNPQITIMANALRIAGGIARGARVTPALADAAAALDRRAFLRLLAMAAGAGVLPSGCSGVQGPPEGQQLVVLSPQTYAVFTAAAMRIVGPQGAALIAARTVDPAAAADAILARSPTVAGPLTQGLLALQFGVWPLLPKLRPFTSLSPDGQDAVLADLAASTVALKRALYGGVRSLVMATFYAAPASRALTGYPGPFGLGTVTIADAMVPPD